MAIITRKALHGSVSGCLDYITRGYKTEDWNLVEGINCGVSTASQEMEMTRRRFRMDEEADRRSHDRVGYHIIQAFDPADDIDPETANEIGCRLVRELYPGFRAVVATHIDRVHLHNHIVISSINMFTGKKLEDRLASEKEGLYALRSKSNELAEIYGYSKCDEPRITSYRKRNYMYAPDSMKEKLKDSIDESISVSYTFRRFESQLKSRGFIASENHGSESYRDFKSRRRIRADRLSDGEYAFQNIENFLSLEKPYDGDDSLLPYLSSEVFLRKMRSSFENADDILKLSGYSEGSVASEDSQNFSYSSESLSEASHGSESNVSDSTENMQNVSEGREAILKLAKRRHQTYQEVFLNEIFQEREIDTFQDAGRARMKLSEEIGKLSEENEELSGITAHSKEIGQAIDIINLYYLRYRDLSEKLSETSEGKSKLEGFKEAYLKAYREQINSDLSSGLVPVNQEKGTVQKEPKMNDDPLKDEPYGREIRKYIRAERYIQESLGITVRKANDVVRMKSEVNGAVRKVNRNSAIMKRDRRELHELNGFSLREDISKRGNIVKIGLGKESPGRNTEMKRIDDPDIVMDMPFMPGHHGYFHSEDIIISSEGDASLYLDSGRRYMIADSRGLRAYISGKELQDAAMKAAVHSGVGMTLPAERDIEEE